MGCIPTPEKGIIELFEWSHFPPQMGMNWNLLLLHRAVVAWSEHRTLSLTVLSWPGLPAPFQPLAFSHLSFPTFKLVKILNPESFKAEMHTQQQKKVIKSVYTARVRKHTALPTWLPKIPIFPHRQNCPRHTEPWHYCVLLILIWNSYDSHSFITMSAPYLNENSQ